MDTALRYALADLRLTWREPSTRTFLFMPLVFLVLLHWGVPALLDAFPVIAPYRMLLLDGVVLQGGLMFGFVSGFLLLDEKDLRLMSVYRISPVSFTRLLLMKLSMPFTLNFLYAFACLVANPLQAFSIPAAMVAGFHFALVTPLLALMVSAIAHNKVEGLTWFKMLDLILIAPFLGFFVPGPWNKVLWIFPTHWVVEGVNRAGAGEWGAFWMDQCIGLFALTVLIMVAIRWYRYRLSKGDEI